MLSRGLNGLRKVRAYRQRREYRERPQPVLSVEQRQFWEENGYLILQGFFPAAAMDRINQLIDEYWATRADRKPYTVADIYIGTDRERRVYFADAPLEARATPYKLNDLFLENDEIRQLILDPRLSAILAELLDGHPLVCNSLNLEYGSQQGDHTDSLYMPAPDNDPNHMLATWIALENAELDAGPLRYWPKSHEIKPFLNEHGTMGYIDTPTMNRYVDYMKSKCEQMDLAPHVFPARKGDVLIWHGQLYHGGEAIKSPGKTRRSLVTHYWRAQDLGGVHGRVGKGRYWLRRDPQKVPAR
jgi:ectoine hydroxylase-related dioxygenase (phytanoyl-CoA dioxygenase family)